MTTRSATALWQKVALILLGLVLAFALLEAGMRLGAFALLSIQEYRNWQSAKQAGSYRVLCLGESTTQGQYPPFLEKILNENSEGLHFSVIDKGRVGTDSFSILAQVESDLDEYKPQLVVAMMGANDQGITYYQDIPENRTWLFQKCHAYRLCRTLLKLCNDRIKCKESIFSSRGSDERGLDEFSAAADSFKKAIEVNSRDDQAYFRLGRLYHRCEKTAQAEALLLKAVELNPQNSGAYFELGQVYHGRGQFILARKNFERALAIDPHNAQAFISLKRVSREHAEVPDREEALLLKATEIVPGFGSYLSLGKFYRDRERWAQAEEAFRKLADYDPNECISYLTLADLYRYWGKPLDAIVQFKKAYEINPLNKVAIRGLLSTYAEMGRPDLAEEWAGKAVRSGVMDFLPQTCRNLRRLKKMLDRRGIKLVCVQYPMRSVVSLKKIFKEDGGVIFVDNERVFKDAVKKSSYKEYFRDMFGGDFGHCTQKGNELLAQNIADVILREVFSRGESVR